MKILILGCSFNPEKGTGITITNLFKNFSKNDLILCNDRIHSSDIERCSSCFQIQSKKKRNSYKFSFIKKFNILRTIGRTFISFKKIKSLFYFNKNKYSNLFKWLEEEKPNVVYSMIINDITKVPLLFYIKRAYKKKMVIHIVDDWISYNHFGLFNFLFKHILIKRFKDLLKISDSLLCISDLMKDVYKKRYGLNFITIHNPENLHQLNKITYENEFSFVYAGTIEEYHLNEIIQFNSILDTIFLKYKINCKLLIYGTLRNKEFNSILDSCKRIIYKGFVSNDKLFEVIERCHALFLPLTFDKKMIKSIKLSMPTKVSLYLSINRPTIIYSPPGIALTEYAKFEKWGLLIENNKTSVIVYNIIKLLKDKKLREKYEERARNVFFKNHEETMILKKFEQLLLS